MPRVRKSRGVLLAWVVALVHCTDGTPAPQCVEPAVFRDGECRLVCNQDRDCPGDQLCDSGICIVGMRDGGGDPQPGDPPPGDSPAGDPGPVQTLDASWINLTGLLAYWRMDDPLGPIARFDDVVDSAGSSDGEAIDGATLDSMAWVPGPVGSALSLDGVDDYAIVEHAAAPGPIGEQLTIMAWVWLSSAIDRTNNEDDLGILCKGVTNDEVYLLTTDEAEEYQLRITTPTGYEGVGSGFGTTQFEVWQHVAATYDGTTMRIYVDGLEEGVEAHSGSLVDDGTDIRIGKRCGNDDRYWMGHIDELSVWARALSPTEIADVYVRQR